jgi:hypothetical protein
VRPFVIGAIKADLGAAIALGLFCAWAYAVTTGFDPPVLRGYPGAAFFPQLILGVLAVLIVALFARALRALRSPPGHEEAAEKRAAAGEVRLDLAAFGLIVGSVFLLIAGIRLFGFEPAATIFLAALLGLRSGRWLRSLIIAAVSAIVMYFLFVQLLKVHLPLALFPRYL